MPAGGRRFRRHPHLLVLGDNAERWPRCGPRAARSSGPIRASPTSSSTSGTPAITESEHMGGHYRFAGGAGCSLSSLVDLLQARMPAPGWFRAAASQVLVVGSGYLCRGRRLRPVVVSSGNLLMVLPNICRNARDLGLHLVVARVSGVPLGAARSRCLPASRDLGRRTADERTSDEGALFGRAA